MLGKIKGKRRRVRHPFLLLPSICPIIRVFSNESALYIRWPRYWSFSVSPSNEYSGFISFRIDCLDVCAIQGTLKSLLQSVQFSCTIMSNSLQPMEWSTQGSLSITITNSRTYSNSCPLSRWCLPTISSSVIPFSSCRQSFPASGSFQMSWLFTSGGRSIGASALACPSNEYPGLISFRVDWFDLFAVQGTVKSLL